MNVGDTNKVRRGYRQLSPEIEEAYFSEALSITKNCTARPFPSPGINRMCAQS